MIRTILAAIAIVLPLPAAAAVVNGCAPRAEMVPYLLAKYGEQIIGRAVDFSGSMIELYVGPETWTITFTKPGGPSCMVDVGNGWQAITPLTGQEL